jgi:outer membrane protein OmpA-like peptidoglycan-associated protein
MVITLDSSYLFVPSKAEILAAARLKLDRIAKALARLGQNKTIVVESHTDSTGSEARNLVLSKQRADAVKSLLVNAGIAPERIRAKGRGELVPIAPNDTPEGRALNRRIEIAVERADVR